MTAKVDGDRACKMGEESTVTMSAIPEASMEMPSTSPDIGSNTEKHVLDIDSTQKDDPHEHVNDESQGSSLHTGQSKTVVENKMPATSQISNLSLNLLSALGLDDIAASVARFDPISGEKINKMRKSYEGQIKNLDLPGRNRAVRYVDLIDPLTFPLPIPSADKTLAASTDEPIKVMGLEELSQWPEEEWYNQHVRGHDFSAPLTEEYKAKVFDAMNFQPGPLPDDLKWRSLLGLDIKPGKSESTTLLHKGQDSRQQQQQGLHETNDPSMIDPISGQNRPVRARRSTKKRRYDDGSFEGYGEGFIDDEVNTDAGYESVETFVSFDSRGERKRRRTRGLSSASLNQE